MREWEDAIRARLAGLRLTPEREMEVVEELSGHMDDHYHERVAAGAPPDEARRAVLAGLQDPDLLERALQPLRQARAPEPIAPGVPGTRLLADLGQDVRYALRTLRHSPGFAAAAIVTLALGIGANTAIFSLVNAVLFRGVVARDPERLVHVSKGTGVFSYPEYVELRDHGPGFEGLAAWGGIVASLNTGGESEIASGLIVTGSYFEVLGLQPSLGRLLAPGDDRQPGAHPVAVLSHDFWRTRFGGRTDVVGKEVLLNGHRFTIVGVGPEGFAGTQFGAARGLYVPMMMQAVMRPPRAGYSGEMNPDLLGVRGNRWLTGLGRLAAGVTPEQAASALTTLVATLGPPRPAGAPPVRILAIPVNIGDPELRSRLQSVAALLMAVVGTVLLLACANVANLMLSRAAARRREVAVRLALGASRFRLVRQLLTESVLVSCAGGLAGLLLAVWIMSAFHGAPPPPGGLPIDVRVSMDGRVLGFTLALSILAGIAFGLAPALSASRPSIVPSLKDESFVPDQRSRRFNLRSALVVAQVALSLVLLMEAGLFLRTLHRLQAVEAGFDVDRLVSAYLPVNLLSPTRTEGRAFYATILERVESLPGVESATLARVALLGGSGRHSSLHIEGRGGADDQFRSEGGGPQVVTRDAVSSNVVGPRYFRTLGIPTLAGRDFEERDGPESSAVAVVNEAFGRLHFPGQPRQTALGHRLSLAGPGGPWREIVGVRGDAKYERLAEDPRPVVYLPLAQNHETGMMLYVRTSGDPASLIPALRRVVQSVEPNLPVPELRTVRDAVASSLYAPRMAALLLGGFAGLALLLAAVGVYGVTSFTIAQRTREIGVRMALGARAHDVLGLVLRQGLRLVGIGVVLGLALAFAAARSVESFLYGVRGRDGLTFAVVPVLLAAVALVACLVPARRAMKMDPLVALRYR